MRRILLPFDGSAAATRAAQYLADHARGTEAVQVHVINVQENPLFVGGMVSGEVMQQIESALQAEGRKLVLQAAQLFEKASIPHQLHVHIGLVAQTIVSQAEALGCESIVMGTRGLGSLSGLVLGSVATRVVHLTHVPVTLVK